MMFHYFGYGSNVLTESLRKRWSGRPPAHGVTMRQEDRTWCAVRCPSARPIGVAEAPDYLLEFSKRSTDGSGKATLGLSVGSGECIFGVVFEILESERTELDKAEGTKDGGYERYDHFPVRLVKDGECHSTSCYLGACAAEVLAASKRRLAVRECAG